MTAGGITAKPGSGRPAKPGDCENNLRIIKMESALRIINTLAAFSASENVFTQQRILDEIRRAATEALQ